MYYSQKKCDICHKSGANHVCYGGRLGKCRRAFHYQCGIEKGAKVNLSLKNYSFCYQHAPNIKNYKENITDIEFKEEKLKRDISSAENTEPNRRKSKNILEISSDSDNEVLAVNTLDVSSDSDNNVLAEKDETPVENPNTDNNINESPGSVVILCFRLDNYYLQIAEDDIIVYEPEKKHKKNNFVKMSAKFRLKQ